MNIKNRSLSVRPIFAGCLVLSAAAVLFISGCSTPPVERNYYIINYSPVPQNPNLILDQPLPYRVEVSNSRISRIYDRSQLVFRYSHHKIEYANNELWAVRLSSSIPDAITNHLVRYNTFATTQRDFLIERPHYEVVTSVNQLEMLQSELYFGAHISMDIFLRRTEDMEYIARHSFNRETELYSDNVEFFVQQISNIIKEETDIFIEKVLRSFNLFTDEDMIAIVPDEPVIEDDEREDFRLAEEERHFGLTEAQVSTWLKPPPREQLIRESKRDLIGMGRLFLPAMSDADPHYTLYSPEDFTNYFERMGSSIYLAPGKYTLHYGSGPENLKMSREITVIRDQTKIVEPDWGGLIIRVIDESRNRVDNQYEVYSVSTTESYGFGQGALEELGEQLQTWILRPGTYKIVLNNKPFNTLEDFVTVDVPVAELRIMTLVVDSETGKLKGAGTIESSEYARDLRDWRIVPQIHASFSLLKDNDEDNPTETWVVNAQFDGRFIYDKYPYYFSSHNILDIGFIKEKEQDFRLSTDSFKQRNTFVYSFSRVIGLYGRADIETHFFNKYSYFAEPRNIRLEDTEGKFIREIEDDRLKIEPSFFPMTFREGAGLNLRLLQRPEASLTVRSGFGMRQDIYKDVLTSYRTAVTDTVANKEYDIYREIESTSQQGLEVSVLANSPDIKRLPLIKHLRIPFIISYNTTADILFPYGDDKATYSWENIFSVRLTRQIAIDYKLNLDYNTDPSKDYTEFQHSINLRLMFLL